MVVEVNIPDLDTPKYAMGRVCGRDSNLGARIDDLISMGSDRNG